MNNSTSSTDKYDVNEVQPWYRQFWAWFILTPLIVVMIVSSITITLAVRYADDRVIDNYYKEGRMINMRLDEDILAQKLNVQAALEFDFEINELALQLNKSNMELPGNLPEQLQLELSHPVQAALDRTLILTRVSANQYHTELFPTLSDRSIQSQALQNRWYLRLLPIYTGKSQASSGDQRKLWRLRGEIDFSKTRSITLNTDALKVSG